MRPDRPACFLSPQAGRGEERAERFIPTRLLPDRYHTVRWIGRVELLDQQAAMLEPLALVDRPLVGDLALVDRERRVHEDRARDPRRGSRGRAEKAGQPFAK